MQTEGSSSPLKFEIGHVLFIDIVGYSKLLINEQSEQLQTLKEIVRGTEQVRLAEAEGKLLRLPTGDGGALVFRTNPEAPVLCAIEIAQALKSHPKVRVRMGIHSGPVNEVRDLNEQANVAGAGINIAQRVMDCGDAGHILLSKHVAEDLEHYPRWQAQLHDLGECEVKHGVRLHVFNLYTREMDKLGNPELPQKLKEHQRATTSRHSPMVYLIPIVALLIPAAFFGPRLLRERHAGKINESLVPSKSIAVLPFANLSEDKANAYFAEGIQDEILTRLSKVADLKVISRTSTQHYKSTPEDLPAIANQLGVANILEGSVQKNADAVRVNVQLIKAGNDSHLWADTFDRKLNDVFAVESEIASSIAETLRVKLTAPEAKALSARPTENSEAHDLYLKGMYFWNKRTAADLKKAIGFFNDAIALDRNYALAWSGLSQAYILLPLYGGAPPAEALPKAKEAAEKAIALDPALGVPHATLANIETATFDFPASMREFEKAVALEPNDATTHHWFGDSVLECIGDNDRAIAEHKRALELDPLSLSINIDLAYSYYMAGRYPEALTRIHKALELDPNSYTAHYNRGWILEASGDLPGAIKEYEKSVALDSDPFALAMLGHAQGRAGNRAAAMDILQKVTGSERYVPSYSIALIYLGLGDKGNAIDWLEKSFEKVEPDLNTIRFDPLLKPLHGDPRFEALAEKVAPAKVIASLVKGDKSENSPNK